MESFLKRLSMVQAELKAPKNQFNKFGRYKFRNCEDILEAVKPLCFKNGLVLVLTDQIVNIENRFYIEATAKLYDTESEQTLEVKASARESETKKGMDESQITGASSSYARKYALNGLFDIDDTKDADTNEFKSNASKMLHSDIEKLEKLALQKGVKCEQLLKKYKVAKLQDLTPEQYESCMTGLNKM